MQDQSGRLYPLFDHVVLLTAPTEVLLSRIDARVDNRFGKSPAERQRVLGDISSVLPLLRASATEEIDSFGSIDSVADQLEAVASTPARIGPVTRRNDVSGRNT